ncbi:MAG: ABC transporter ATP-binding protein [Deltaproteobacteria bacterium]|nr:ABC transporter ATP-binding protein [Deltaproteobacteria bacterium]
MDVLLSIQEISKQFGHKTVLSKISLDLPSQGLVGLVGPNGSGKTTLLKIMANMLSSDQGLVAIKGSAHLPHKQARHCISYIDQDPALDPELSAYEMLQLFSTLYALPRARISEKINEVIVGFSLQDFLHTPCARLSGGQRQRVHIAIGMLSDAPAIFFDEPTRGMDAHIQNDFWQYIAQVKTTKLLVVVSHDLEKIQDYCDYVYLLSKGRILTHGSPSNLLQNHQRTRVELAFEKNNFPNQDTIAKIKENSSAQDLHVSPHALHFFMQGDSYRLPHWVESMEHIAKVHRYGPSIREIFFYQTGETIQAKPEHGKTKKGRR